MESEIIQYDNLVWDRIEQYLCQNKRDDKNSNWKSYKEVKAHLSDTQTKLIKSSKYFSFEFNCIFVMENVFSLYYFEIFVLFEYRGCWMASMYTYYNN